MHTHKSLRLSIICLAEYLSNATVFRTELKSCRCSDEKRQSEVDLNICFFSFSIENSFDYYSNDDSNGDHSNAAAAAAAAADDDDGDLL